VGDLSNSSPTPTVLVGYISEFDLTRQLHRSAHALQRLPATRSGPATHKKSAALSITKWNRFALGWRSRKKEASRKRPVSRPPPEASKLGIREAVCLGLVTAAPRMRTDHQTF
jgi:hypothetical protein